MTLDFNDTGDAASLVVVLGAVSNVLPPIAAALAIIWTLIRIYEWVRFRIFRASDEAFK